MKAAPEIKCKIRFKYKQSCRKTVTRNEDANERNISCKQYNSSNFMGRSESESVMMLIQYWIAEQILQLVSLPSLSLMLI